MKKLFTAVPMKKLLLATTLVAMTSTATAANSNDSAELDKKPSRNISVTATYVVPITLGLNVNKIDFGDVYLDSGSLGTYAVTATVGGEKDETFTYSISANAPILITADGAAADAASINGDVFATTVFQGTNSITQDIIFDVGLDKDALGGSDVNEIITFEVFYDSIADAQGASNDT